MKIAAVVKIAAFIPLALAVGILVALGLRESALGNWSGLTLLVPALTVFLLMALSWKWPFWGGLLMLLAAAIKTSLFRGSSLIPGDALWQPVILPAVLAGAGPLLLIAGVLEYRETRMARARTAALPHRRPPQDSGAGHSS